MKIERFFKDANRYHFDFGQCSYENGFAQIDSRQDASYYGQWCSPTALTIVSYAEGDVTISQAESPAEFAEAMRKTEAWHTKNDGSPCRIDPGFDPAMTAAFESLGLGDMLH